MKLRFEKNKDGEIIVKVDEKTFSTKDYIEMIKEIKNEKKIDAEFGSDITEEEEISVKSMLESINNIEEADYQETNSVDESVGEDEEEINPDDIPF
ncbi:MAG: hypothetical protein HOC78_03805 [Candidatus Komeilibacteria bacterium]|jgi:hypothetical protein|nr:hypothetical protein [Candidatus Komeilibacteria bacterium]